MRVKQGWDQRVSMPQRQGQRSFMVGSTCGRSSAVSFASGRISDSVTAVMLVGLGGEKHSADLEGGPLRLAEKNHTITSPSLALVCSGALPRLAATPPEGS